MRDIRYRVPNIFGCKIWRYDCSLPCVHRIEARAQLGGERRLLLRRILAAQRGPDNAVVCGALCDAQESEQPIILTDWILPHPVRDRNMDALSRVKLLFVLHDYC